MKTFISEIYSEKNTFTFFFIFGTTINQEKICIKNVKFIPQAEKKKIEKCIARTQTRNAQRNSKGIDKKMHRETSKFDIKENDKKECMKIAIMEENTVMHVKIRLLKHLNTAC